MEGEEGGGEGEERGRAGVRPEGQWLKVPVYTRATGVFLLTTG